MGRAAAAGFTLIELIVTISIFLVLLGAATLSFRGTSASRTLRQAADEVRLAIDQARALALAPAVGATAAIPGYRFRITGPRSYELREMDVTHADGTVVSGQVLQSGSLPSDLEFMSPRPFADLDFSIAQQGKIIAPVSPTGQINLVIDRPSGYVGRVTLLIYTTTGQVQRLD